MASQRHDRDTQTTGWVVALLTGAALVAAVCVLVFMLAAMRNARLAAQQSLTEVYARHLDSVVRQLDRAWANRRTQLAAQIRRSPAEAFAEVVRSGLADSVVIYGSNGEPAYPNNAPTEVVIPQESSEEWQHAERLEFREVNYSKAAGAYEAIASTATSVDVRARALRAQARCLLKAGETEAAVERLNTLATSPLLTNAVDEQKALVVPSAQLRLLKLISNPESPLFRITLTALKRQLNDYEDSRLPSRQRHFLMSELAVMTDVADLDTWPAEKAAAEFLAVHTNRLAETGLRPSRVSGWWSLFLPEANLVALYRTTSVLELGRSVIDAVSLPEAEVNLLSPPVEAAAERQPLVLEVGGRMPGWKLAMSFRGEDPFAAAHRHEVRTYTGVGLLAVCLIGLFALGIGKVLSARLRLVQMQQHLVSSVSHELRTPVASIRALVDTLLAKRVHDPGQVQDYLQLVAQENERLSHLIDSFLTFARLEQRRQPFRLEPTCLAPIVRASVELVADRFRPPSSQLRVEVDPNLPPVMADPDALKTVLLNLLDNAWKYTGDAKQVSLRAYADNGSVYLAITDNGVGLTREQASHVFDRFYQADQSLARRTGGCGLGLSIVRFIVEAHRGSVVVEGEVGRGSTFTVRLPAMEKLPTSD